GRHRPRPPARPRPGPGRRVALDPSRLGAPGRRREPRGREPRLGRAPPYATVAGRRARSSRRHGGRPPARGAGGQGTVLVPARAAVARVARARGPVPRDASRGARDAGTARRIPEPAGRRRGAGAAQRPGRRADRAPVPPRARGAGGAVRGLHRGAGGRAVQRLGQHGADPDPQHLSQAGRLDPQGGRRGGPGARARRRLSAAPAAAPPTREGAAVACRQAQLSASYDASALPETSTPSTVPATSTVTVPPSTDAARVANDW